MYIEESVLRSVCGNGEREFHFPIERRHRRSIDQQTAAKIQPGPAWKLGKRRLIKERELEGGAFRKGALRDDETGVAGAGDGAAAGADGGGAIGGDELAACERGGGFVGCGDGDGEDVVNGGRELARDGAVVEDGEGENDAVGLVDDEDRGARRERAGRSGNLDVAVLIGHGEDEHVGIEIGRSDGLGGKGDGGNSDQSAESIGKTGGGQGVSGGRLQSRKRKDREARAAL